MAAAKIQVSFGKVFRVLEKKESQPYSIILENRQQENALLFESNVIALLSSQEIEAVKRQYTKLQDAYGCLGILEFDPGTGLIQFLVTVTGCMSVGKTNDYEIYKVTQTVFTSLQNQSMNEDHVSEIKKLLHSGAFYFSRSIGSNSYDITLCSQRQKVTNFTDNRFFWNRMLHTYFVRYGINTSLWLFKVMCGSFEIKTVYIRHRQARACIISRLSCERAGTRFNVRGCNDDGHVANFVESEQVIYLDTMVTSYIQTRGSVPLFWEQTGVQVGSHKVKLSRGIECCAQAYDNHFQTLKYRYGNIVIVNLLSSNLAGSRESEAALNNIYVTHHNESSHCNVPHISFDYHNECRGGNTKNLIKLKEQLSSYISQFDIFFANGNDVISEQNGVIRTNCLDCLDRTNCVQTFIGLEILLTQLKLICEPEWQQVISRFEEVFKQMWVNNGNEISRIYAGTGAIQGGSKLLDGARSAARTIQNNLLDSSKQESIDILLLGSLMNSELADRAKMLMSSSTLYAPSIILEEMCKRYKEFTYQCQIRVAVGTYNVNGGKHFRSVAHKDESLADWLLDAVRIAKTKSIIDTFITNDDEVPIDIFAIGFEEIVDLNAGNIMAASTENANLWAEELQKVLSRDQKYALLTYVQLVGVCLFIFVKCDIAMAIRDVAVDSVKTGLGGAAGNKGAVAIRFSIYSSSLCFICSHFAAGQSQVNERNADYVEISKKIEFPVARTLSSHDYIFWCGDFNYRIDMDKDTLKEHIKNNMIEDILQYDQLTIQKNENKIFQGYIEGDITFAPTYKYDLFSDDYDTSDKCRAPAWTDRVLWKKCPQYSEHLSEDWNPGRLIHYGRTELKQSDHRPVLAIIEVDIRCVDIEKRDTVFNNVIESVGPLDGTIILKPDQSNQADMFDDNFMVAILQNLSALGEICLMRYVEDTICVTFKDGRSALKAVNISPIRIADCDLHVSLKCESWFQQNLVEINICSDNTIPLSTSVKFSPSSTSKASNTNIVHNRNVPPMRPAPIINKPKAGLFSIPTNLHQPLQPTVMNQQSEKRIPTRPAPPPPQTSTSASPTSSASYIVSTENVSLSPDSTLSVTIPNMQSVPPPVPRRQTAPSTAVTTVEYNSDIPPPVPARNNLPPIPPR